MQQELKMASNEITILSTRPVRAGARQIASKMGISIDEISFIETTPSLLPEVRTTISNMFDQVKTVAFTSMNAVEAVASCLNSTRPKWKIFCIGNTTRELVIKYFGEDSITGIADDARTLADVILSKSGGTNIVFFCGDRYRDELPQMLQLNNIPTEIIVVYHTDLLKHIISKEYNGILFFSPSAVQSFFSVNTINGSTVLFAIGNTTASEIKKYCNNTVIVGDSPGKDELVNTMSSYFSNLKSI